MVFLVIKTKNLIEGVEIELQDALQIIAYGSKIRYKFEIIEDVEKIKVLKEFFGKDNFCVSLCYGINTVQTIKTEMFNDLYKNKITDLLKIDKEKYSDLVKKLLDLYFNPTLLYVDNAMRKTKKDIDNIVGLIRLAHMKLDINITCVIASYLNVDSYKDYLYELHKELYRHLYRNAELEVYIDEKLPNFYITMKNNLIIKEHEDKTIVYGKLLNGKIEPIDASDYYLIDIYGLSEDKDIKTIRKIYERSSRSYEY